MIGSHGHVKAALFVDFDNVFIHLEKVNQKAATQFAYNPMRWLRWLEGGGHEGDQGGDPGNETAGRRRSILTRRCYLNPVSFGGYRSYFSRCAFSVIDCPPLTTQGKNSADIVMVMDILDTLNHPTRFDEFIILSADADFTPVILRLRAYDRQTAIWTNQTSAAAYKAACDFVVDQNQFIEEALGVVAAAEPERRGPAGAGAGTGAAAAFEDLLPTVAAALVTRARASGPIPGSSVHESFLKFPQFHNSSWFGFRSLRSLVEHLCLLRPELDCGNGGDLQWQIRYVADRSGLTTEQMDDEALRDRIMTIVRDELRGADGPVALAHLGQVVRRVLGRGVKEDRQWAGHGTLKALILASGDPEIDIDNAGTGHVFDRTRHLALPDVAMPDSVPPVSPELDEFIDRIANVTGIPRLHPDAYAALFATVAEALKSGRCDDQIALEDLVRRLGQGRGRVVDSQAISFVITGLAQSPTTRTDAELDAGTIGAIFRDFAIETCRNAQLSLDEREAQLFAAWLGGTALPPASTSSPVPHEPPEEVAPVPDPNLAPAQSFDPYLKSTADRVLEAVDRQGALIGRDLIAIVSEVNLIHDRSWFGCGSLRGLTERLLAIRPELAVVSGERNVWQLVRRSSDDQGRPDAFAPSAALPTGLPPPPLSPPLSPQIAA